MYKPEAELQARRANQVSTGVTRSRVELVLPRYSRANATTVSSLRELCQLARRFGFLQVSNAFVRRPLRRQFHHRTTGRIDLVLSRFAKAVCLHRQLLGDLSIAENLDFIKRALGNVSSIHDFQRDRVAVIEQLAEPSDVDREHFDRPLVVETTLGNSPEHRRTTALEVGFAAVSAAAFVSVVSTARRFADTTTGTTSDPSSLAVLRDSAMNFVKLHSNCAELGGSRAETLARSTS